MGFGVVSLLDAVFRRSFTSAGLRPGSATIDDADTTVYFWAHRSLLASPLPPTAADEPDHARRPVVVLIHGFGPGRTWQWSAAASTTLSSRKAGDDVDAVDDVGGEAVLTDMDAADVDLSSYDSDGGGRRGRATGKHPSIARSAALGIDRSLC